MKYNTRYITVAVAFLIVNLTYSQAPQLDKKNLAANPIYQAQEIPAPPLFIPELVDKDNATVAIKDNLLHISVPKAGNYTQALWAQTVSNGFNPSGDYTVEIKAQVANSTNDAIFNIQSCDATGKGFRLGIGDSALVANTDNRLSPKLLDSHANSQDIHTFRYAVQTSQQKVHVYRDDEFVATEWLTELPKENLFPNGNFESDEPIIWGGHVNEYTSEAAFVHSGDKALMTSNGWWTGPWHPAIRIVPNTDYRLSFWVKGNNLDGSMFQDLLIKVNNATIYTARIDRTWSDWKQVSINFKTSASAEVLTVNFPLVVLDGWARVCSFSLDDFELVALNKYANPFLSFGKTLSTNSLDASIRSVNYDLTGAYAPETYNRPYLETLINNANTLYANTSVGTSIGQVPLYAKERFSVVLQDAITIQENSEETALNIENGTIMLKEAIALFEHSILSEEMVPLASIDFSASKTRIREGNKEQTTVTGLLQNGTSADISVANISYRSLNESVATINEQGEISALTEGTAEIEVTVQLIDVVLVKTLSIEVYLFELAEVRFESYQPKLEQGEAVGTKVDLIMSDQSLYDPSKATITYFSQTPSIATINARGSIIGVSAGEAVLTVSVEVNNKPAIQQNLVIEVVALSEISILGVPEILDVNQQVTLKLEGVMSDGSTLNLTRANATLRVSDREIAGATTFGVVGAKKRELFDIVGFVRRGEVVKTVTYTVNKNISHTEINKGAAEIMIYPNPATDYISFNVTHSAQVEFYTLAGILVRQMQISDAAPQWVGDLKRGCYIVKIAEGDTNCSQKIVLQ